MENIDKTLLRDIILLYCPQKVGSTSLVTSFRLSASDKYFTMHTHEDLIFKALGNLENSIYVEDIIKNTCMKNVNTMSPRKIYIIDVYRTPIERKISEYFHDLSSYHFNNTEDNIAEYSLQKIINRFNDIFPHVSNEDYYFEKYNIMDTDMSIYSDIKPMAYEFNFKKKYLLYEKNGVTYIKLRLKDSSEWGQILSEIFNTEITVVYDYETRDKNIGELYNKFLNEYQLPFNYFKMIEECKYLKLYYDFNERYEYLNNWWKKTTGLYNPFKEDEYAFYKKIYMENQFYFRKLLNHYKDDGCLCPICKDKREKVLTKIKNGIGGMEIIQHNLEVNNNVDKIKGNNSVVVKKFYKNGTSVDIILSLIL